MDEDGPDSRSEQLRAIVAAAWAAESGQLHGIPCPQCGQPTVSVWFTPPRRGVYFIWYVCTNCAFETRGQYSGPPSFFTEKRLRTEEEVMSRRNLGSTEPRRPPADWRG